ncbi:hypothetical protein [Paenibacillus sp. FSL R10-2771]
MRKPHFTQQPHELPVNTGQSLAGLVRLVGLVGLPGLAGLTE